MVTIYSKNNCMQCKLTKLFLNNNNIKFNEINVDEDKNALENLKSQGLKQLPIVKLNNELIASGFQPNKLKVLI